MKKLLHKAEANGLIIKSLYNLYGEIVTNLKLTI